MDKVQEQTRNTAELVEQLNRLVDELENYPDAIVREKTLDLVQIILKLHREALRHILASLELSREKEQIISRIAGDEVTRTILLIHELLPTDLNTRVTIALDELRPLLLSHGCDVKLLTVENGNARIRLIRYGKGAPPIATLKLEIEQAMSRAVPELLEIQIEGAPEASKLFQIREEKPAQSDDRNWVSVIRSLSFKDRHLETINYADIHLLVCKTGGEFYAYRNSCALENRPLDDATFEDPMLICACHGYHYDLSGGGICVERPDIKLQSLPVKVEDDKVKVAM